MDQMSQSQEKLLYWKLRLMVAAVETIVLTDDPKPGISSSTKNRLKQLFGEATMRWVTSEGNGCLTSQPEYLQYDQMHPHTATTENKSPLLGKWLKIELKKIAEELIQIYTEKCKGSEEIRDQELLRELKRVAHQDSLDLIFDNINGDLQEEAELDFEIEKCKRQRDSELEGCTVETVEMNDALMNFKQDVVAGKYISLMEQYADFLKIENEFLQTKERLTSIRQTIAENPPEVTHNLEEAYRRLLDSREKIEGTMQDLVHKKAKYESLGPEFPQLLADWKDYGRLIENKKWVLMKLETDQTSLNASFSDSLTFDSPG